MIEVKHNEVSKKLPTVSEVNKFPCLGKSKASGIVVSFITKDCGIVIESDTPMEKVGSISADWNSKNFIYLERGSSATFTITNE